MNPRFLSRSFAITNSAALRRGCWRVWLLPAPAFWLGVLIWILLGLWRNWRVLLERMVRICWMGFTGIGVKILDCREKRRSVAKSNMFSSADWIWFTTRREFLLLLLRFEFRLLFATLVHLSLWFFPAQKLSIRLHCFQILYLEPQLHDFVIISSYENINYLNNCNKLITEKCKHKQEENHE